MKRSISLILALVLCLSLFALAGCGKKPSASLPFEATIDKVFSCGSYNGTVLVVELNIVNTSKEYVESSTVTYNLVGTLDGSTLTQTYLGSDNPYFVDSKKIAPGESGKAQAVFEWNGDNEEGELKFVGVTYTTDYSEQLEYINQTLDVSEVEQVVSETEYELTIDNVLKTDDGEGNELLVVDMTFVNNSSEATSFGYAIGLEVFQNDTSLKTGSLPYNHPASDDELRSNSYLDVRGGASVPVRQVYVLNDGSAPVEVKAVDNASFDKAIILEKEIQI